MQIQHFLDSVIEILHCNTQEDKCIRLTEQKLLPHYRNYQILNNEPVGQTLGIELSKHIPIQSQSPKLSAVDRLKN